MVDKSVHAGTAQRWHTVMWALAGLYAALARGSRFRMIASFVVVGLCVAGGYRLHRNLDDYDDAAVYSREIRRMIKEAPTDLVFVYNVMPYDGASAFYAVGMGQTEVPPFGDGKKSVYPIFQTKRFGVDPQSQTPIAPHLLQQGRACTTLWLDVAQRRVDVIPDSMLLAKAAPIVALPRIDVKVPSQPISENVESLTIEIDTSGLARFNIYLVCTISELMFQRYREFEHAFGDWDRGTRDLPRGPPAHAGVRQLHVETRGRALLAVDHGVRHDGAFGEPDQGLGGLRVEGDGSAGRARSIAAAATDTIE